MKKISFKKNIAVALVLNFFLMGYLSAQPQTDSNQTTQPVAVKKISSDKAISNRLTGIFDATGWYENIQIRVDDGVVFIEGIADSQKHSDWATQLAYKTEDVVAVVNQLHINAEKVANLTPIWSETKTLWQEFIRYSPLLGLGLLLLIVAIILAKLTTRISAHFLQKRMKSQLLVTVISRILAIPVFIFGLYLILRISHLTNLAMTVIGGTSLIGLVIGFAFRDIAENFLASILLSIQRPFATGDLIEVAGYQGYVQSVNTRSTLLMTLDGNHVQISNAKVYKETITNFTANPKMRISFKVGIGYDDSISEAQSTALKVLQDHPAVLSDPEPLVLAEELASATVNLGIYCWIDVDKYSPLRVRSAIIRLVKHSFQSGGIEMPDDAREIIFPRGVPVKMLSNEEAKKVEVKSSEEKQREMQKNQEQNVHLAEGNLESEEEDIQKQAQRSRNPEEAPDIVKNES